MESGKSAHEANGSVSRAPAKRRIDDDGSSIGKPLFRSGHRIEVPAHANGSVSLRPGKLKSGTLESN